ncbi:MAG: YqgE/AlgH family protein [Lishizhenia sp.]
MNLDIRFENTKLPSKGKLLLSEPFLDDDYFGRSAVYLCEHNEEGSFGFVLNNYIEVDLNDVAKNFPVEKAKVSMGGPVATQNIYFIHTRPDLLKNSTQIADKLFIGGDYPEMIHLLETRVMNLSEVRFFLGYSGWSKHQLKEEIEANSWLVVDVESDDVMNTNLDAIWNKYMEKQGSKYKMMTTFPINPQDN